MKNYELNEILHSIKKEEPFFKKTNDDSISIFVYEYVPIVGLSIHSGKKMDKALHFNLKISEIEREAEEERFIDFFIQDLPIKIIINDSKLKYDVDKSIKQLINQELFKKPLNDFTLNKLRSKHQEFYIILEALISKLLRKNKTIYLYDIHSFKGDASDKTFKIETNKKLTAIAAESEISNFGNVCHHYHPNLNSANSINDFIEVLSESHLSNWLNSHFENRVILFRINIKSSYFKEYFSRYDTSSLNLVRLIVKHYILLKHERDFLALKKKNDMILV